MAAAIFSAQAFAAPPVIGITATPSAGRHVVTADYVTAVTLAGGIPVLLPATADPQQTEATLDRIDGVLLTGGVDVDPAYYGEQRHPMLGEVNDARDAFEMLLIDRAVRRGMPVFGICRGMQVLNVALGGTLWQDIPSQVPEAGNHSQGDSTTLIAHTVLIEPGTVSAQVMGVTSVETNSRHHQSVCKVAPTLKVTAWSTDGIDEMLEGYPERPILAVQWHPENFVAADGDKVMLRFFRFLADEATRYRAACQ